MTIQTSSDLTTGTKYDKPYRPTHTGIILTINGVTYHSLKECCEKLNLNYGFITSRRPASKYQYEQVIYDCLAREEAKNDYKPQKRPLKGACIYRYKGRSYRTRADACKDLDICLATLEYQMRKHRSFEMAVEHCLSVRKKGSRQPVTVNGVLYPNKHAACSEAGISYKAVMRYVTNKNCSFEDAINYYLSLGSDIIRNRPVQVKIGDKIFPSIKECCIRYGISIEGVREYMKNHDCSIEDAINHVREMKHNRTVLFNGKRYKTILACCKDLRIEYSQVNQYKFHHKTSSAVAIAAVLYKKIAREEEFRQFKEACR